MLLAHSNMVYGSSGKKTILLCNCINLGCLFSPSEIQVSLGQRVGGRFYAYAAMLQYCRICLGKITNYMACDLCSILPLDELLSPVINTFELFGCRLICVACFWISFQIRTVGTFL